MTHCAPLPPSARTRVRRIAENARYDTATVQAIVDAALVCHIAFAGADGVHCLPTACWRIADALYIHGSNGSRLIKALAAGAEAAVTITHVDGLVLARSAFNHSMNYRSVTIYGRFAPVPEVDKPGALAALLNILCRGARSRCGRATPMNWPPPRSCGFHCRNRPPRSAAARRRTTRAICNGPYGRACCRWH